MLKSVFNVIISLVDTNALYMANLKSTGTKIGTNIGTKIGTRGHKYLFIVFYYLLLSSYIFLSDICYKVIFQ